MRLTPIDPSSFRLPWPSVSFEGFQRARSCMSLFALDPAVTVPNLAAKKISPAG
jgi:hypothetical protein